MRFDKKTVDAGRDRCARNGFDHFGLPAGHAARLVGLLQRMGNVHNHGITEVLHRRDAAHIDDQVVITEGRAPVGQHHVRIARIADFPGGEGHRFRSEKLSLFDIDDLAGLRGGNQQIGLAAQESRYLQHVDVFGGDRSLFRVVDIGHYRHAESAPDVGQQFQRLFIADPAERVEPRTVRLAVRRFEYIGNTQPLGDPAGCFGHGFQHIRVLDDARSGHQEKHAAAGMFDIRNSVQHFVHILGILSGKDNKTSRYDKYPPQTASGEARLRLFFIRIK